MKANATILILSICYLVMLVTILAVEKINTGQPRNDKLHSADLVALNYLHVILMAVMTLASYIIHPLPYFLMQFPDRISTYQLAAFLITFGVISFLPWKKFSHFVTLSQHFLPATTSGIAMYASLRTVFLVIYEWFFRGLLLVSCSVWLGIYWGIAINVLLYTLLHANKSKKEMFGCIPFGLMVCVFTIWWQSIWPAIIFHLQIAVVNEWSLLQKFNSLQKQNAL